MADAGTLVCQQMSRPLLRGRQRRMPPEHCIIDEFYKSTDPSLLQECKRQKRDPTRLPPERKRGKFDRATREQLTHYCLLKWHEDHLKNQVIGKMAQEILALRSREHAPTQRQVRAAPLHPLPVAPSPRRPALGTIPDTYQAFRTPEYITSPIVFCKEDTVPPASPIPSAPLIGTAGSSPAYEPGQPTPRSSKEYQTKKTRITNVYAGDAVQSEADAALAWRQVVTDARNERLTNLEVELHHEALQSAVTRMRKGTKRKREHGVESGVDIS